MFINPLGISSLKSITIEKSLSVLINFVTGFFKTVPEPTPLEADRIRVLNSPLVELTLGTENQFGGDRGTNSSCTSCAENFLTNVLSDGTSRLIQSDRIDTILQDAFDNFELIHHNITIVAQREGMPKPPQALPVHTCLEFYGLKLLGMCGNSAASLLVKGEDGTTKGFFNELLVEFKEKIGPKKALGGVIQSQNKTFALALFSNDGRDDEWALFDSHGDPVLNNSNGAAYVKRTSSLEQMADFLATLIEYKSFNIEDVSREHEVIMENEYNDFGLFVLVVGDQNRSPEVVEVIEQGPPPVIPEEEAPVQLPAEKIVPPVKTPSPEETKTETGDNEEILCPDAMIEEIAINVQMVAFILISFTAVSGSLIFYKTRHFRALSATVA